MLPVARAPAGAFLMENGTMRSFDGRPTWGARLTVGGTGRSTRFEVGPFWLNEIRPTNAPRIEMRFVADFTGSTLRQTGYGSATNVAFRGSPENFRGWETRCALVLAQENRLMIWGMAGEVVGEILLSSTDGRLIGGPDILVGTGRFDP
jgi:hypothetical protein